MAHYIFFVVVNQSNLIHLYSTSSGLVQKPRNKKILPSCYENVPLFLYEVAVPMLRVSTAELRGNVALFQSGLGSFQFSPNLRCGPTVSVRTRLRVHAAEMIDGC